MDNYAKWLEILSVGNPLTSTSIHALKELFSHFCVPEKNFSDNGIQFTGSEFRNFCRSLSVKHVTTPPYHPRSNGQAERSVDTFKRALKKNNGLDTEQQFLSIYRITPNPNTISGKSPAELMFSRKIRSVFDRLLPVRKKKKKNYSNDKNCKITEYTQSITGPETRYF